MERQLIFGNKTLVRGGGVLAHPQHLIAEGQETLVVVPQVTRLGGAAGGTVLGVEIEHQFLSGEIGKADGVAILVLTFKGRGFGSYGEHNF